MSIGAKTILVIVLAGGSIIISISTGNLLLGMVGIILAFVIPMAI